MRRPDHLAHDPLVQRRRDDRRRRVGAHAAGVRALVAVAKALVVLRGRERQHVAAVGHDDEARFLALEELLDDDHAARLAEGAREHVLGRADRLRGARGDDHALAGGEPVGLDDDRRALCADRRRVEGLARERGIARRRDAVARGTPW